VGYVILINIFSKENAHFMFILLNRETNCSATATRLNMDRGWREYSGYYTIPSIEEYRFRECTSVKLLRPVSFYSR